jgi:putative transposase
VVDYVGYWQTRAEITAAPMIDWLGISNSKFYDWRKRYGLANEHNGKVPRDHWLLDGEKQAIIRYYFETVAN